MGKLKRATPEAVKLRIVELRAHGYTLPEIAAEVGMARNTVTVILREMRLRYAAEQISDVPYDMDESYYWREARTQPSRPAGEVLDWRLTPAERAHRQHATPNPRRRGLGERIADAVARMVDEQPG